MTADTTLTATFTGPQSLVVTRSGTGSGTVSSSPAGISCGTSCSAVFSYGATVNLTAGASTGSTFAGWTGDCSGASTTCTIAMIAARNVTAKFNPITPTLSVTMAGSGTGTVTDNAGQISCPGTCTGTYAYNQTVTLTATPGPGMSFSSWSGACSSTAVTCTVTLTAASNVTATFTINSYAVSVSLVGDATGTVTSNIGLTCPGACSGSATYGSTIVLTASPGSGAVFSGWTGACAGQGASCAFVLTASASATAEFDQASYTITQTNKPGGVVDSTPAGIHCGSPLGSSCAATFSRNTVVNLSLTPKPPKGMIVDSITWTGTDDDAGCADMASCTITASSNRSFTVSVLYCDISIGC
jgi:uncharacterized repeat protein (TIGR02543 family)